MKKENREKIRTICGLNEKEKNIYFQSTYKSITDNFSQEDIYEFGDPYEDEEDGCAGNCCGCSGCEDTEK